MDGIEAALGRLQLMQGRFLGKAMRFRDQASAGFDPMALLCYAAVKRTLFLLDGFTKMLEDRNLVCAGALLRVQLDTALRFYASFLVAEPRDFAKAILRGAKVSAVIDRQGQRLTDRYLVERAAQEFPWLASVYEQASGFIHFSEKHLLFDQSPVEPNPPSALVAVNINSFNDVSDSTLGAAAEAFEKTGELVDLYVARWVEAEKQARTV